MTQQQHTVAEYPVLFNTEMVRAILDGRKTQTRRPIFRSGADPQHHMVWKTPSGWQDGDLPLRCPFGQPGDLLWVRETWADVHPLQVADGRYSQGGRAGIPGPPPVQYRTIYKADGEYPPIWHASGFPYRALSTTDALALKCYPQGVGYGWTPSIHMPRWACRLFLRVTDVRAERLQDISEEDARAEGVDHIPSAPAALNHRTAFAGLWNKVYVKAGLTWQDNPWVWAISFEVLEGRP